MLQRLAGAVGLVAMAGVVFAVTLLEPAAINRTSSLQPDRSSKLVCVPAAPPATVALSGAKAGGRLGQDRTAVEPELQLADQSEPYVVTGDAGLSGVAAAGGSAVADWSGCVPAQAEGTILVPSTADTELLLVNTDPSDASVDLTLHGTDGDIATVGARGIAISAGASRVIALSVLADVEGPVAVSYRASRGRASVVARTVGLGVLDSARPSQVATDLVLTGIPAGQEQVTVLLANPSEARATVEVTAFGASAAYTPPGGEGVSVPPRSALAVDIGAALAGEASGFRLQSDLPVAAALALGTPDRATVEPAVPGTELATAAPADATLVITNPGDVDAAVEVTADGTTRPLPVPAGTTTALEVGAGPVGVSSAVPVVAALVTHGADGTAAHVLTAVDAGAASLDALIDPTLR